MLVPDVDGAKRPDCPSCDLVNAGVDHHRVVDGQERPSLGASPPDFGNHHALLAHGGRARESSIH
jgi:hypothetical protein